MNVKYFIAKRYLFSKKESRFISFITYISVAGIALGVAVLIITVSILSGFETEIRDKVAGLVSHIQISSFRSGGIKNYNEVIHNIKSTIPEVTSISGYVQKECVLKCKDNIEGVILKGISSVDELNNARNHILKGEAVVGKIDSTFSRIVIGDKLASKYNIQVGDKVLSSGLGEHFPAGYAVGTVAKIRRHNSGEFAEIDVTPAAQLATGHHVVVLFSDSLAKEQPYADR